MNLFQLFSVLFLLGIHGKSNYLKSRKLQRNVPTVKFTICGWKILSEMTSLCALFVLCCQTYDIIVIIVLNSSFCLHSYTCFPLQSDGPLKVTKGHQSSEKFISYPANNIQVIEKYGLKAKMSGKAGMWACTL